MAKKPKEKKKGMTEGDLLNTLKSENTAAERHYATGVAGEQDEALRRYLGEPLKGDEDTKGASTAISKDIAQVVDAALPDLIEPFVANEHAVEFEADEKGGDKQADQETMACNYVFHRDNNGLMLLHDAFKDSLIQKRGHFKVYWKEETKRKRKRWASIPPEALVLLQNKTPPKGLKVSVESVEQHEDGTVSAEIRMTKKQGRVKIEVLPPEEFLISPTVQNEDSEEVPYKAHRCIKTRSQLIKMEFDRKKVDMLSAASGTQEEDSSEENRDRFVQEQNNNDSKDRSKDRFTLYEEYVHTDMNGDGVAELLRVYRVNETILEYEEVDSDPFVTGEAIRLPHTFYGESLADKAKQVQSIKTGLTRSMNDNVAMNVRPRIEIPEAAERGSGDTINDVLDVQIGRPIRTKSPNMLNPIVTPDLTAGIHNAFAHFDDMREQDTGITRNGMGMSADIIDNEKSATEARNTDKHQSARKRLMVRLLAESLVKPLFRKIRMCLTEYQKEPRSIRSGKDNEFVLFDPTTWDIETSPNISVGLGHHNRDEKMMSVQAIVGAQAQAMPLGMVTKKELYNAAADLVDAAGMGNVGRYFVEPQEGDEQIPPPPDPKAEAEKAKIEMAGRKMMADQQVSQAKLQMDAQEGQQELAMKQEQLELDHSLKRQQMQAEFALKEEQMAAEFALKREEMALEAKIKREIGSQGGNIGGSVRPGGAVG